jgi:hypothetical protein
LQSPGVIDIYAILLYALYRKMCKLWYSEMLLSMQWIKVLVR